MNQNLSSNNTPKCQLSPTIVNKSDNNYPSQTDEETLVRLCRENIEEKPLTIKEVRSYLYYFASLATDEQLRVIANKKDHLLSMGEYRGKCKGNIIELAALVRSAKKYKDHQLRLKKYRDQDPAKFKKLAEKDQRVIEKYKKAGGRKSPIKDWVRAHYELIRKLHNNDSMNWRAVSRYLQNQYNKKISHTYLQELYSDFSK